MNDLFQNFLFRVTPDDSLHWAGKLFYMALNVVISFGTLWAVIYVISRAWHAGVLDAIR